ncbi:MAG: trypsin-like peptidase domain-containing protein [Planctomycetota bacterium]
MTCRPPAVAALSFAVAMFAPALRAQEPGKALQERQPSLLVVEPDEHERDLRMTPVVRAVQKAADSVVSIYITHAQNGQGTGLAAHRNVTEGQGSGVILDENGFVITNWHVIATALGNDALSVEVKLKDGRARAARILSHSPEHDLALMQLQLQEGERVQPVSIGLSKDLMIGETVVAIGNPQGHANTVTSGVLSAIGRSIRVQAPDRTMREYSGLLQTDAAINQGNSGGALLDITGRLIGINNAMAMGAENIGFAIPVDTMREVFETQLLSSDSMTNAADAPWLGMDVEQQGEAVVVARVVRGGPAATAGIRNGDLIEAATGEPIRSRLDFTRRLLRADQDKPFALRLVRDRERIDLAPKPWSRAEGGVLAMTGLVLEEVQPSQDRELVENVTRTFWRGKRAFRVPLFGAVLRVVEVQDGSPAAALRVAPGDVLMAAEVPSRFGGWGEEPLESRRSFAGWLHQLQGRTLRVIVLRGNEDLVGTLDVRALEGDAKR